ncbi:hypothetical protein BJ138DRAFT_108699 [Hygrophoropsis aurantiaca]|uniref:Uncharacterized protein n=1 Tax=Hygrophoropsis aurantiaca TaxID=72124 RepID=A0ACB8ABF4_9AGAM|nr:hypothetical protein BJ138DRAFT_108699 [Hygrophoropsis aurantiaca]
MIGLSYVEINSTTREISLPPQTVSERNDAIIGAILICSSVIAVILLTRWWLRRTSRRKAHHRELYAARPFMGLSISRRHTASSLPISRPASPQSTDQVVLYHSGASRHTGAQNLPNLIESTAPASPPLASVPNPPTKTSRQRIANRSRPQLPLEPRVPVRPSRLAPNLQQRNGVIDRGPQAPIIELPPPYNTHMFMRL